MKLSKFYSFIFFFLISPPYVLAQDFVYPKGVYMNIEEIIEKNPSRYHDLEILMRTEGDITMNGGNDYKIISKDRQLKKKLIKNNVYAVSDGKDLYVNGTQFKCQIWYCKVEQINKKSLIFKGDVSIHEDMALHLMFGSFAAVAKSRMRQVYVLNLETGKAKQVTRGFLEEMLQDDVGLLQSYKAEEMPKNADVILKYTALLFRGEVIQSNF